MECRRFKKIDFQITDKSYKMTNEKKSGIWLEHASAHLMEYADPVLARHFSRCRLKQARHNQFS